MKSRYPKLVDLLKEDAGDTKEENKLSSREKYLDHVKKHGHTPAPSKVRDFLESLGLSGTTFINEDGELLIDMVVEGMDGRAVERTGNISYEEAMQNMLIHSGEQLWHAISDGSLLPDDIKKEAGNVGHFQLRLVNPEQLSSLKPFVNPKEFGDLHLYSLQSPREDRTLLVILPGNVPSDYKEELQKVALRSMRSTTEYQNIVSPLPVSHRFEESLSRGSLYPKLIDLITESSNLVGFKWYVTTPTPTDLKHRKYFQELLSDIIDDVTPLASRNEISAENYMKLVRDETMNKNRLGGINNPDVAEHSKVFSDIIFISSSLEEKPGGDGMGCNLEIHVDGELIAKKFGQLTGLKAGQKKDGSHQSDDDLKNIVLELFDEASRDVVDTLDAFYYNTGKEYREDKEDHNKETGKKKKSRMGQRIQKFKDSKSKKIEESLSRGSLYRKRYYGRY